MMNWYLLCTPNAVHEHDFFTIFCLLQEESSFGSMLELSWRGSKTVKLDNSSQQERKFLKDGDTVIMKGICDNNKGIRLGFGPCESKILPAFQ